jgi:hypothetical protein
MPVMPQVSLLVPRHSLMILAATRPKHGESLPDLVVEARRPSAARESEVERDPTRHSGFNDGR